MPGMSEEKRPLSPKEQLAIIAGCYPDSSPPAHKRRWFWFSPRKLMLWDLPIAVLAICYWSAHSPLPPDYGLFFLLREKIVGTALLVAVWIVLPPLFGSVTERLHVSKPTP